MTSRYVWTVLPLQLCSAPLEFPESPLRKWVCLYYTATSRSEQPLLLGRNFISINTNQFDVLAYTLLFPRGACELFANCADLHVLTLCAHSNYTPSHALTLCTHGYTRTLHARTHCSRTRSSHAHAAAGLQPHALQPHTSQSHTLLHILLVYTRCSRMLHARTCKL
jgi:hypothetical protein